MLGVFLEHIEAKAIASTFYRAFSSHPSQFQVAKEALDSLLCREDAFECIVCIISSLFANINHNSIMNEALHSASSKHEAEVPIFANGPLHSEDLSRFNDHIEVTVKCIEL